MFGIDSLTDRQSPFTVGDKVKTSKGKEVTVVEVNGYIVTCDDGNKYDVGYLKGII